MGRVGMAWTTVTTGIARADDIDLLTATDLPLAPRPDWTSFRSPNAVLVECA
jgi:hypothetical protein